MGMKNKKISETILKRSVLKLITCKNQNVIKGGAPGQDCSAIDAGDKYILTSTECALTRERLAPYFAVIRAVNNIAVCGGNAIAASAAFILRDDFDEKSLKEITRMVNEACGECGIQLSGGHTEQTENALHNMVTITVIGLCRKDKLLSIKEASAGMAVVAVNRIAIEQTAYMVDEHRAELLERLPVSYVEQADCLYKQACIVKEAQIAADSGAAAMHDMAQKGIFAALWELAAGSGCGLDIDMRAIPIKQETVEFCEIMGLNPYEEASAGGLLVVTANPGKLLEAYSAEHIPAVVIGYLTSDNDKKLVNGDEVRYLDKP